MTEITTRALRPSDLTIMLDMVRALAAHHDDQAQTTIPDLERDCLGVAPWLRVLVAEHAQSVVGYAALCPLAQLQFGARGMDMHHLFVAQNMRGKGVGRALITASVALSKLLGCRYVTVGTHPENMVAGKVYEAAGFEPLSPPGPRFRIKL